MRHIKKAQDGVKKIKKSPNTPESLRRTRLNLEISKFQENQKQKERDEMIKRKANQVAPPEGKSLGKAKDGKWIQKATASIKRRGTEGKCTPITKPGCTGRAKALAMTFKKMAKKRKKK